MNSFECADIQYLHLAEFPVPATEEGDVEGVRVLAVMGDPEHPELYIKLEFRLKGESDYRYYSDTTVDSPLRLEIERNCFHTALRACAERLYLEEPEICTARAD